MYLSSYFFFVATIAWDGDRGGHIFERGGGGGGVGGGGAGGGGSGEGVARRGRVRTGRNSEKSKVSAFVISCSCM